MLGEVKALAPNIAVSRTPVDEAPPTGAAAADAPEIMQQPGSALLGWSTGAE